MRAVAEAARRQHDHLDRIESNLPAYLPGRDGAPAGARLTVDIPTDPSAAAARGGVGARLPSPSSSCPRRYVTGQEAASLPSYMTHGGRVTPDRLNAVLEELCGFAEVWARQMQLARAKSTRVGDRELTHLRDVLLNVAQNGMIKGRYFCLESDLRRGAHTKQDSTGRAALMALRHLGRVVEVKCQLAHAEPGGSVISVIVLL